MALKSWFDHGKIYPCIESTLDLELDNVFIRVWRNEQEIQSLYDNEDILTVARMLKNITIKEVALIMVEMPRVNAVQVKSKDGKGIVIYKNWP